MQVHFIASNRGIKDNIERFRKILKSVNSKGHSLTRDWVEPAFKLAEAGQSFDDLDWKHIYKENMSALVKADVVIVEATVKSFAVGFQTAVALQLKKPTLLLSNDEESRKTYTAGLEDSLLVPKHYSDEKELEKYVSEFIQDNTIETKDMRFNFFIDRPIYNYLRWTSHRTGKTKAEILRELVEREIERDTKLTV